MKQSKVYSQDEVITLMRQRQGVKQQNDFAKEMNISAQLLCDIYKRNRNISPAILDFLGLEKFVVYRPTRT